MRRQDVLTTANSDKAAEDDGFLLVNHDMSFNTRANQLNHHFNTLWKSCYAKLSGKQACILENSSSNDISGNAESDDQLAAQLDVYGKLYTVVGLVAKGLFEVVPELVMDHKLRTAIHRWQIQCQERIAEWRSRDPLQLDISAAWTLIDRNAILDTLVREERWQVVTLKLVGGSSTIGKLEEGWDMCD